MADIPIYGTLHNVTGEPISTADQSMDKYFGKDQATLNKLFSQGLNALGESIAVNFGIPQDSIIYELFGYDNDDTESTGTTVVDSGNGSTATNHAAVIWDDDTNTLYVYLSTALAFGLTICTANGQLLKVASNGNSTNTNNYGSITFATKPTSIAITPSLAIADGWHWTVDGNSRNITPTISLNL